MPDFYNCFMYIYRVGHAKLESLALFMPCSSKVQNNASASDTRNQYE